MKIISDYEGSAIDIIEEDKETNSFIVSPKEEGKKYSNYYNFIVENNSNKKGIVIIKNINNQQYDVLPEYKRPLMNKNGKYIYLDDSRYCIADGNLNITILPNEKIEISSTPKYTFEDLDKYLSTIDNVTINNDGIKEIIIGDESKKAIFIIGRQHPGETLSSYFIEGLISSIINNNLSNNNCFVIYPIVNQKGVIEGNHRLTNDIDYNRMWNTDGVLSEIDYIKKQFNKYDVSFFIDVHCDEITPKDYIRTKESDIKELIDNIQVIDDQSKLKRFVRALVKQGKVINVFDKTAREYVNSKYNTDTMLIELSMSNIDREERYNLGYDFIQKLMGEEIHEEHFNTRKK